VDEDNPEHEKFAITLRENLIQMMEAKVSEMSNDDMFLPKLKLQETILQFRQIYGAHPMNLVRVIKNSLATETKLVQHADSVSQLCFNLVDFQPI
jgi:signal transducer and activator of transcription 5B